MHPDNSVSLFRFAVPEFFVLWCKKASKVLYKSGTMTDITVVTTFYRYIICARVSLLQNYNCTIALWSSSENSNNTTVFIVDKPVKREIFAANFRDRIVHHYLISCLNPLFERYFIYDSYSCRVNKGTHLGVARVERFIRQCSKNNTIPSWVLKIDLKGYFMSIDRSLLLEKLFAFIDQDYKKQNKEFLKDLCKTIITNEPTHECIFHSKFSAWEGLPKDKSLFYAKPHCGLPIGNYTSQVFANFYLAEFDYFITQNCGIKYYGRYVDDCVLVHESKSVLNKDLDFFQYSLWNELTIIRKFIS